MNVTVDYRVGGYYGVIQRNIASGAHPIVVVSNECNCDGEYCELMLSTGRGFKAKQEYGG